MSDKPGTFQKGDKRINRKGRPRSFDALRKLAQSIAFEEVPIKDRNGQPTGETLTVVDAILRQWAQSKDPRLQIAFIELAYGKVPQRQELTGAGGEGVKIVVEYARSPSNS